MNKTALILILTNLLIGCKSNATSCEVFPSIPDLKAEEKQRLKEANMPKEWIKSIGDYREIRREVCK